MSRGKIFAGSSSRQFVLVIENVGTSLQFSGMRQPPAMLELRPNIFAVNPPQQISQRTKSGSWAGWSFEVPLMV